MYGARLRSRLGTLVLGVVLLIGGGVGCEFLKEKMDRIEKVVSKKEKNGSTSENQHGGKEVDESDPLEIGSSVEDTESNSSPERGPQTSTEGAADTERSSSSTRSEKAPHQRGAALAARSKVRWSPSGQYLVVEQRRNGHSGLAVVRLDGIEDRFIPGAKEGWWFPQGGRLAYIGRDTSRAPAHAPQIFVADLRADTTWQLTSFLNTASVLARPVPSPRGRRIAFIHSGRQGGPEVYLMDRQARNVRQLTQGTGRITRLAWGPRGRNLTVRRRKGPDTVRSIIVDLREGTSWTIGSRSDR